MILQHAGRYPELRTTVGNEEALARGAAIGLVPPSLARSVTAAYRQYRHWMHRERLAGNETVLVPPAQAEPHREAVTSLWRVWFATDVEG